MKEPNRGGEGKAGTREGRAGGSGSGEATPEDPERGTRGTGTSPGDAGWDRPAVKRERERRPPAAYGLLGLVLFQGLSGLAGGLGLMADPSGASLGIPVEWLEGSPFQSYLIPGTVLFALLGIFPLVISYGVARGRAWSWAGSLAVGLTLLGFLTVEILVVGVQLQPPLQPIYAVVGVGIIVLAMAPSVRGWLRPTDRAPRL